ncbi:MAG: DNA internalization-related competence protein ComEC/Rec2 [Gammaproteobacteria bacterium]
MRLFSLAFLLGILLLQNFSYLPSSKWIWIILAMTVCAGLFRHLRLFCACALGFAYCLWFAHAQMTWTLPPNLEGKNITITGYIVSIPAVEQHRSSFLFKIKSTHSLVKLSWQSDTQNLHAGDKWRLTVRLKRIHGLMNPGSFDYEAWALQEGIRAQGYIVARGKNELISSHWYHYPLTRVREYIKNKIEKNLPPSNTSPWIIALTVGERHGINQENWEVLRNTGTNHLMAIAGLHIGFMSGFIYTMVAWLWRRSLRLTYIMPAQHAGGIAALAIALIYSALAGFLIPTQRACIMLTVFLIVVLLRRKTLSWQAWSVAMFIVLLINPLHVLSESFWLSFGAVAAIIFGVSARLSPTGLWWKWGRIQWVIALGLVPFSIWLFQQCSIVSFVANSIAIPWVGFLIVPLCMLGTIVLLFSANLGGIILTLADKILGLLWVILTWFAHLTWGSWYQVMPNLWILFAACIGVIILLLPRGFPGKLFGFIGFLPLIFYQIPALPSGEFRLTLLDVGQGLASVVETRNHILVFDTGPKLSSSFDMGESVVVPFLRTLAVNRVDMLVVSHGDNDHIGGANAVLKRFTVANIKTSVPEDLPSSHTSLCLRGETWDWEGVNFKFIYPSLENLNLGNDSSCVLRISNGNKTILLTGDIEKLSEKYLVNAEKQNLSADIIVAPHHGSKTSANIDFLQAVNPRYVLFPIGYRNRYHFPHASVVEAYDNLGTKKIDTVDAGAIQFLLKNDAILAPHSFRVLHHRYWNN